MIYLGLYAGLRVSESERIDDAAWSEERGRLTFVGKGRKQREVPIHPELARVKENVLVKPVGVGCLKHSCRALAYASGIAFTSHSLRRTFAVNLSEAGIGREVIGALLGHAPLSVTESYCPVRWSEAVEAVSALTYSEEN